MGVDFVGNDGWAGWWVSEWGSGLKWWESEEVGMDWDGGKL